MTTAIIIYPAPDGEPVTVHTTVRAAGAVAYQLIGTRLHGTVLIQPDVPEAEPLPSHLHLQLGDGTRTIATHLFDLPVVDGIPVDGWGYAPIHASTGRPQYSIRSTTPQCDVPREHVPLPEDAKRYLLGVLDALVEQYRQLDVDALAHAAARATADLRLSRLTHYTILPNARLLAETAEELADAYEAAERLQALSPLHLVPAHAPSRCRCLPDADPETPITATDDGDWLTCTTCTALTVLIEPGTTLIRLLQEHTAHRCPPAPPGRDVPHQPHI